MKIRPASSAYLSLPYSSIRRYSDLSSVSNELLSRPINITYDYLSPTPSHLLNVALCDFLPSSCYPKYFTTSNASLPAISSYTTEPRPHALHQGHHLVYFPPAIPHHGLLPDGTDTLHSPAAPTPFTRRLWAGGSLSFNPASTSRFHLDGARAACVEKIKDVTIRGKEGDEKIFVHIERRYGYLNQSRHWDTRWHIEASIPETEVIQNIWEENEAAIVERRNLVFMKAKESFKPGDLAGERIVKRVYNPFARPVDYHVCMMQSADTEQRSALHTPEFSVTLSPPPSLLFRFSALTFNAHAIHIDRSYSRDVEKHRNLLVHGPLTLVMMLSVLQSQLKDGEMVTSFTYRNLAPLYAQEEMRVCLRKEGQREDGRRYEVWIEGRGGGYAVKASAAVGQLDLDSGIV